MQLTRQIVETTAAIKVFIIDSILDYSPFSREIEISGNSFLREIKPILFSGPMVRARIQQLILRFKNSMGDTYQTQDRLTLISLENYEIARLLKGEKIYPKINYHRLELYSLMIMLKAAAGSQDDIDMAPMRAQFQAEADLFIKKEGSK